MRTDDINIGGHYAYDEYQNDLDIWAEEVEVIEVAPDTEGPYGSRTVHVRFVDGPRLVRGFPVSETWVRRTMIVCDWKEAEATLAARRQRNDEIEEAARNAARSAEEHARENASSRFAMQKVDTAWIITLDPEVQSSVVTPVATLNRAFFADDQAFRILVDLRDRVIKQAGEKARREVYKRMRDGSRS